MDKLEAMLKYVSEHNDFYKKRIAEYGIKNPLDITQWPVLTRKELQENRYNMFSDDGKTKYFNEVLIRHNSSGSSGIPINVYWSYNDYYASNLALWRKRLKWYNIHPNDKFISFTLNSFDIINKDKTILYRIFPSNTMSVNVSLLRDNKEWIELIKKIQSFEPIWLYIQPYILERLLIVFKETGMNPPKSLRYIETVGEVFSDNLRVKAKEFFRIPIANMYGSEEMNCIAYECPFHNMHIISDNVYVECLSGEGITEQGYGETIITNLNNYVMPLIRYSQGDITHINNKINKCECGLTSKIISAIDGRKNEIIKIGDTEFNIQVIFESIAGVNNQYNDIITDYKIQYNKRTGIIICKITVHEKNRAWYPTISDAIEKTINSKNNMIDNNKVKVVCGMIDDMSKKRRILDVIE